MGIQLPKIEAETPLLVMGGLSSGSEYVVLSNGHGPEEGMHVAIRIKPAERVDAGRIVFAGTIRMAYDATYQNEGVVVEFKTEKAIADAFPDTKLHWANHDDRRFSTYFMFGIPLNVYTKQDKVKDIVSYALVESILAAVAEGVGISINRGYKKTVMGYLLNEFITSAQATLATIPDDDSGETKTTAEIGGEVIQLSDYLIETD